MDRLEYETYEDFVSEIADTFGSLEDDFGDVSIIAKYDEAKEIIRELLNQEYDMASIDIHKEEFEEYYDEYRIALNQDGIWCEKFKHENGYLDDDAFVTFIMDNCSSAVFKHIDSEELYEVCVGEDELSEYEYSDDYDDDDEYESEHSYMVNGKSVDKETFDEYVSQFASNLVDNDTDDEDKEDTDSGYSVTVEVGLDADEAEKIIRDMRKNFQRELFDMFGVPYRPLPLRFFW